MPSLVPIVIEKEGQVERAFDIFSRLLKDRIIFVGTEINDQIASLVIAQILFLANEKKDHDINVYINSPGGYVHSGLAIVDTMEFVPCDIKTYCIGMAASIGAVLLAAGEKGKRFALPNAKILLHQPWASGIGGAASDIKIHADDIVKTRKRINEILAFHTGQAIEKIEKDTDRDFIMTAEEAKEYGIIDEVLPYSKG